MKTQVILPDWFDKPERHPDFIDAACDDALLLLGWKCTYIDLLKGLVKELAACAPAPVESVPAPAPKPEMAYFSGTPFCPTCLQQVVLRHQWSHGSLSQLQESGKIPRFKIVPIEASDSPAVPAPAGLDLRHWQSGEPIMDADDLRDLIQEYADADREYHSMPEGPGEKGVLKARNEAMHCAIEGFTEWVKYARRASLSPRPSPAPGEERKGGDHGN